MNPSPYRTIELRELGQDFFAWQANGGLYVPGKEPNTALFVVNDETLFRITRRAGLLERLFPSLLPREFVVRQFSCGPTPIFPTLGGFGNKLGGFAP